MKKILYIDNSEGLQILLQKNPSEEGYEVFIANGIEGVLSKFRRIEPDFLILELRPRDAKEENFKKLKKNIIQKFLGLDILHSTNVRANLVNGSISILRNHPIQMSLKI